jgi:uncharacterized protein (DUF58 family)
MIVPRNRLLFWTGMAVPLVGLAVAVPATALAAATPVAVLVVLVLADAFMAPGRLKGIKIMMADVIRLTKDRDGTIEIRFFHEQAKVKRLRVGLSLPAVIKSEKPEMEAELPANQIASLVPWPCRAIRRGRYHMNRVFIEVTSPLGFWAARKKQDVNTEIRVYPNVFPDRKGLSALFLGRGLSGLHAQRQVGKGRDFEKLREYQAGDSYEDIHWKTTAKRGYPVTKTYQIEKTQEVYLLIDASRLSARSSKLVSERRLSARTTDTAPDTILERFVTSALVVGLAAQRQGDLFGLITFSDRVDTFLRAKNGKAHYDACREALYTAQPRGVTPDFSEVFTFIATHLRRRALLVFLTNMDDPVLAESFIRHHSVISRRHLVLVNMLRPPGARPLFSSDQVGSVRDLYKALGGHLLWENLAELQKKLRQGNVDFSTVDNENMAAELITQYLAVKQRQLL